MTFDGYRRDDGLWDIEGELRDTKHRSWISPDDGVLAPGATIHHMFVRLTLRPDHTVIAVEVSMDTTPFGACRGVIDGLQKLVGERVVAGWRKAIDTHLGGTSGCTHVRELLVTMGTAAYQAIGGSRRDTASPEPDVEGDRPPRQIDQCMAWAADGDVVRRHHPLFYRQKN